MARRVVAFLILASVLIASPASATTPVTLSLTGTSVTAAELSWSVSNDLCFVQYQLQYRLESSSGWTLGVNVTSKSSTSAALPGLSSGTTYDFRVVDFDCLLSTSSNVVTASTAQPPVVTAVATATSAIDVGWTSSRDHCFDHYEVQYRIQGATAWTGGSPLVSITSTAGQLTGLATGTTYEAQVLDFDCWGAAASAPAAATTFRFQPQLTASQSEASGPLGGIVSFAVTVANLGNTFDTLALSAGAPPAGWDVQISPTSVPLAAGTSSQATVAVILPQTYTGLRSWVASVAAASSGGIQSSPVTLNATLAMADLALHPEDVTMAPTAPSAGDTVVFDATVRNFGTAAASGVVVRLHAGTQTQNQTVDLAAGGSAHVTLQFRAEGGVELVSLAVDPDGVVPEFDETDNHVEWVVDASTALPDLTVRAADISVTPAQPNAGDTLAVDATVRNVGAAAASGVPVRLQVGSEVETAVVDVPAGGSAQARFEVAASEGALVFTLQVDPDNLFAELNETDNAASFTVVVNSTVRNLADLSVSASDIRFNLTDPQPGDLVRANATVSNHGTALAAAAVIRMRAGAATYNATFDLPAGRSAIASFSFRAAFGLQVISFELDPDGLIPELNEVDNRAEVALNITAPDLEVQPTDIRYTGGVVVEGDRIQIVVTVRNLGLRASPGFDILLVIGGKYSARASVAPLENAGAEAVANFSWTTKAGLYLLEATVDSSLAIKESDEQNNRANATLVVDARPEARLTGPDTFAPGEPVVFAGGESSDLDGTVAAYLFDFGDGTNSSWIENSATVHTYWAPGAFEVRLWVKDQFGVQSNATSKAVVVAAASEVPPARPPTGPTVPAMAAIALIVGAAIMGFLLGTSPRARARRAAARDRGGLKTAEPPPSPPAPNPAAEKTPPSQPVMRPVRVATNRPLSRHPGTREVDPRDASAWRPR